MDFNEKLSFQVINVFLHGGTVQGVGNANRDLDIMVMLQPTRNCPCS